MRATTNKQASPPESSSERRITVHKTIYPKLQQLAARDGVAVADVANAILLQTLQPYGQQHPAPLDQSTSPPTEQSSLVPAALPVPDPYQAASVSAW